WKEVDAVRNSRIYYFPCGLTCRTATQTGTFVGWLASRIYSQDFADPSGQVQPDSVYRSRPLELDLPYIRSARVAYSRIYDFTNKSLIVDLKKPMRVVSTLEGQRENIQTVGNHYSPPPVWSISHQMGLDASRARIYRVLGHKAGETAFLFTGADMDNLSIQQRHFREMTVYALVTAGVTSNAVRMSRDTGNYYEPGTINILLFTNRRLSPRAMTRAIISATEAKTAALLDMDVRSSYRPLHRATGTGTDNVLVIEGAGTPIDNTGGHSKMGELIASAVYEGVQEAVYRQNGLQTQRSIFRRLKDRKISIYGLVAGAVCDCGMAPSEIGATAEEILLQPTYAGFMSSALALSDAYQQGLITDLSAFRKWSHAMAETIADHPIGVLKPIITSETIPDVERIALNAIFNGIYHRAKKGA
ncbi:MAG: adenosylcobinamide amidohydrolase, partial [Desulfobacterales bacterium]|nr:adenosylcobinamide amidohydrolase [Desulfobacterales bacterium]